MEGVMDPGRPSPLKHARRFAPITLVSGRRSPQRPSTISPGARRTVVGPISDADCAASFAAPMTGAGEQPGRERPHPRTAYPDPRVGSGVAHVPAADEMVFRDLSMRRRVRLSAEF